jgi:1-acyl-sn-glycerol-3-phosphate acyltransferase
VPVFGWIGLATGMVPLARTNRAKAIQTLAAAVRSSRATGAPPRLLSAARWLRSARAVGRAAGSARGRGAGRPIMISPEGTRSKTGQLLDFKKGPFYIREEMQACRPSGAPPCRLCATAPEPRAGERAG